jgi:hypothetical protein
VGDLNAGILIFRVARDVRVAFGERAEELVGGGTCSRARAEPGEGVATAGDEEQ